jgi:hypothetical protein
MRLSLHAEIAIDYFALRGLSEFPGPDRAKAARVNVCF